MAAIPNEPSAREVCEELESLLYTESSRLLRRVRTTKFYGGCITADFSGCQFDCAYCWAHASNAVPEAKVKPISPEALARRMMKLALAKPAATISAFRLSGAETLPGPRSAVFCAALAIQLRALAPTGMQTALIIETNGLGLGVFGTAITEVLAAAGDALKVRHCLKGVSAQSFAKVTGRPPEWFPLVLRGAAALRAAGIPHHLAIMDKLLEKEQPDAEVASLLQNGTVEVEQLNPRYAGVKERLSRRGLDW